MFIKSQFGLFNTDVIESIKVSGNATFAYSPGHDKPVTISASNVLDKIADALKNGENFLEVK